MRRARESAHGAVMIAMAGEAEQRVIACVESARELRAFSRRAGLHSRTRATARLMARHEKAKVPVYRRLVAIFSAVG